MLGFPLWETFVGKGAGLWPGLSPPVLEEGLALLIGVLLPPALCLPHPMLPFVSAFTLSPPPSSSLCCLPLPYLSSFCHA